MVLVLPEQDDLPARTAARFAEVHGGPPAVVARAPGRANLIGEHTDYNGGPCLPFALPHATYVAARARTDRRLRATTAAEGHPAVDVALDELAPGTVPGWGAFVAGTVWALREAGVAVPGLELHLDSVVPPGAGLGSSAALTAAVAVATTALTAPPPGTGEEPPAEPDELLLACLRAEREFAGAPTGGMDQTVALHAAEGHALLLDFGVDPPTRHHVPLAPVTGEHTLVVLDSRVRHAHLSGGYADRRAECENAARQLAVEHLGAAAPSAVAALPPGTARSRALHVVTETARVHRAVTALESGDGAGVGALLTGSHGSLRDEFGVSVPELDLLVDTALEHGALGARLTGGGFGGSVLALLPREREADIQDAVQRAASAAGQAEPGVLPACAARAAGVVPPAQWSQG